MGHLFERRNTLNNVEKLLWESQTLSSSPNSMAFQLGLRKPDDDAGSSIKAILIGLFVAFGGVLYGYVCLLVRERSSVL